MFVLEGLQRFRFPSFIHRHIIGTHTQPQIMGETALFTLWRGEKKLVRKIRERHHFLD